MKGSAIYKDIYVSDLFKSWPALLSLFMDQKLDCIGCSLVRFCTVEDIAVAYDLDLDEFITILNEYVQTQDDEK